MSTALSTSQSTISSNALLFNVSKDVLDAGLVRLSDCLFPVGTSDLLYTAEAKPNEAAMVQTDPNHLVVVRQDTQKVVGVHKKGYKVVPNADIFTPLLAALYSSGINTSGMITDVKTPYEGGQTIVNFRFPEERISIHPTKNGMPDELEMVITVVNSYNGAWAFRADLGAYRLVCSNGAYIGAKMIDIYARHTSGLDIDKSVNALSKALETFKANEIVWKKWALAKVDIEQARTLLEGAAFLSGKALEDVLARFESESDRLGKMTVWSLFNGLTEWATHAEMRVKEQNQPSIVYKRQQQVAAFTSGKKFLEFVDTVAEAV